MPDTHLFGEMDIDFSESVDKIYRRAFNIAESCGYMVTTDGSKEQPYLEFFGEDCPDGMIVTTRAFFDPATKKVLKVEKRVMKEKFDARWKPQHEILKTIPIPI